MVIKSSSANFQNLPDGFEVTFKVPPQGDVMSEQLVENTKATAKTAIISNLILSTIFKNAMGKLLASILIFQLLAHLPLADIVLPANAL